MTAHIKIPTINSQPVLSFYSVRSCREVKMFEPMLEPRLCRLGTGISKEEEPRMQSILRLWLAGGCFVTGEMFQMQNLLSKGQNNEH